MSDFASGKNGGSDLPGRPIQPGQVLNPEGKNQYTYKRDFELTIDRLLKGELSPEEAESVPEWVRELVRPGMTRGEALALVTVAGALRGDPKHLAVVLKRIWPETQKHEISRADATPPALTPLENLNEEDRRLMLRLTQKAIRGDSGKPLFDELLEERKRTRMALVRGDEEQ